MNLISITSLTPDFSQVSDATLMTVDNSLGALSTWLTPGVNESPTFLCSGAI